MIRSAPGARDEATVGPGAVAQLSAFDRSQTRRERAEQEIDGHPERHLRGAAACAVGGGLGPSLMGQHIDYKKDVPVTNLLLTMLDRLEVRPDRLGDSTGPLVF